MLNKEEKHTPLKIKLHKNKYWKVYSFLLENRKYKKVKSDNVNKICGKRRAEIANWQASKSDTHAKITLLQYGLIELIDYDYYSLSKIGQEFIDLFDDNNKIIEINVIIIFFIEIIIVI